MKEAKEDGTPTDAVERLHLPVQRAPCRARSPIGVPPRFLPKGLFIPKAHPGPGFVHNAADTAIYRPALPAMHLARRS